MENVTASGNNNTGPVYLDQGVNVWGLVGTIFFYLVILFIGLYASWKNKAYRGTDSEDVMLAGRNMGFTVGLFTMTATWVGGGFICGTAELVFTPGQGLVMCSLPVGYSFSLVVSGIFFAGQMRQHGYTTMLDPFVEKYSKVMAGIMYIPCLFGDMFWTAAILSALGASLAVILGIDKVTAILLSSGIATFYTVVGGLYSVIFTDVIQMVCIFIGLWLGAAFAMCNPVVKPIVETATGPDGWLGRFPRDHTLWLFIENILLMTLGGIPWQAYIQRVLASRTVRIARFLPIVAGFACMVLAVPAVLIGAVAASADWNRTEYRLYRPVPVQKEDYTLILPLVLQYLTPIPVAVIGLGAVSAAVMSSADSSLMSSASMFAHNIYAPFLEALTKKQISQRQRLWAMRAAILCVGALATIIAITIQSIYFLVVLCADLVYVVAFPQLTCVVHFSRANTYGALTGYIVAFVLRLAAGEPLIGLPSLIRYPFYDQANNIQYFPHKTLAMLISLSVIIGVSYMTEFLFKNGHLPQRYDIFQCFTANEKAELYNGKAEMGADVKGIMDHRDLNGESVQMLTKKETSM